MSKALKTTSETRCISFAAMRKSNWNKDETIVTPMLTVAVSYTAADTPARPSAPHPSCAAHTACSGTL